MSLSLGVELVVPHYLSHLPFGCNHTVVQSPTELLHVDFLCHDFHVADSFAENCCIYCQNIDFGSCFVRCGEQFVNFLCSDT